MATALVAAPAATAARTTHVLDCAGKPVVRPVPTFVLSCADANAELTHIRWSSWTVRSATGRATLALNLCVPNCAASRMSFFKHTSVRLSDPKHGLFTRVVVTYELHGKTRSFIGYPRTS